VAEFTMNAQHRTVTGKKVKTIRNQGMVPLVVYGPRMEPKALQVVYRELEVTLMKAGGTNLIDINVGDEVYTALARDVQRDPIYGTIKHVDFFAVDENARVVIDVPVVFVGESAAVAARKGIMLNGPGSLRIEMKAINMMNNVTVDLANHGNIGDALYVRDLELGENARILNDPEEMILRIVQSSAARREDALSKVAEMQGEGAGESEF
jgi:large subunit ribosomal protein L25